MATAVNAIHPTTCQGVSSPATAWYSFTPAETGSYLVSRPGYGPVAAYTGSSATRTRPTTVIAPATKVKP